MIYLALIYSIALNAILAFIAISLVYGFKNQLRKIRNIEQETQILKARSQQGNGSFVSLNKGSLQERPDSILSDPDEIPHFIRYRRDVPFEVKLTPSTEIDLDNPQNLTFEQMELLEERRAAMDESLTAERSMQEFLNPEEF